MTVEALSTTGRKVIKRLTLAGLVAAFCGVAPPIYAQDAGDDELILEEVIVTGYRKSLEVALDLKRDSVGTVDAIMAEDIADFPDTNLAESLQRIPGVAIDRTNGEGREITVRGLGARYTMTRINGMETRVGQGGSTDRGFDFNVFASELFNSIVVRKTAAADLQEGSLGSIVDLNTAHAFDYQEGMTAVIGGQAQYNDLSEDWGPRFTGLYAWHDPSGTWGFTASAAWSQMNNLTATGNTVRWQKSPFNSVKGVNCTAFPDDAGCLEVAAAQHARIPRYGTNELERDRLGLTAGFQWAPSDRTTLTVDGMYAKYDTTTDFQTLEVLFRGNERGMDVTNYTIQPYPDRYGIGNNTIIAMDVDNAWVRSENYHQETKTKFDQISLVFDHEFSDDWRMNFMAGTTNSKDDQPVVTTLMYDDRDYNGYRYDYSQSTKYPSLSFNGPDVTDASIYTLTELRDQIASIDSGFDAIDLSTAWDFTDSDTLSAGYGWKKFTFDRTQVRRDGTVCKLYPNECADGGLGPQGSSASSGDYTYPGKVGAGSNTSWAYPDIPYWTDYLDYYNYPTTIDQGRTNSVKEKSQSLWLMVDGQHMLGNMNFMYNAGVRYVETDQTSTGYISGEVGTIDRPKYHNWLPSFNTALWFTDELVGRVSWAKTMSRPALGNLVPGGSVDSFGFVVNGQNPLLDPTLSDNWDFGLEWYFTDESVLSFAYFIKDIKSFPIRGTRIGTYASTGYPLSAIAPTSPASQNPEGTCGNPEGCWEITQLVNGPGAKLKGWELSFQTPFGELFGADVPVWRNMGMIANYTSVKSDVDYDYKGNLIVAPILGLSENSYNITLYYENDKFSTRLSWAHRSDYNFAGPNYQDNLWQYTNASTYLDFTSRYIFNEHWDMTFEILNLTDEAYSTEVDVDARRRFTYDNTGRNFLLGVRYKF